LLILRGFAASRRTPDHLAKGEVEGWGSSVALRAWQNASNESFNGRFRDE
jgi:hypothetical protein